LFRIFAFTVSYLCSTATIIFAGTVDTAQRMLNQLGYNAGPVDGAYGGKTRGALESFYSDNEGSFDGKLDANEIADLKKAMSTLGIQIYQPQTSFEIMNSFVVDPSKQDLLVETNIRNNRGLNQHIWYGHELVRGDFNGDGLNDLIVTGVPRDAALTHQENSECMSSQIPTHVKKYCEAPYGKPLIAWGETSTKVGRFTTVPFINETGKGHFNGLPLAADFNGDGIADIWIAESGPDYNGNPDGLYLSNGDGTWTYSPKNIKGIGKTFAHGGAPGDIDGDGDIDVVTTSKGKGLHCYFNNGEGVFTHKWCNRNFIGYTVALADIDGDGDLDAYAGGNSYNGRGGLGQYGGGAFILKNNGRGSFSKDTKLPNIGCWVTNPKTVTMDVDGDGDYDFVSSFTQNWYLFQAVQIVENLGKGDWKVHNYEITSFETFDKWGAYDNNVHVSGQQLREDWTITKRCNILYKGKQNYVEGHPLNHNVEDFRQVDVDGDGVLDIVMLRYFADEVRDPAALEIHGGWLKSNGTASGFTHYSRYDERSNLKNIPRS